MRCWALGRCIRMWLGGVVAVLCAAGPVAAQAPDRTEPLPAEVEGVEITEHLGERVPMELAFVDDRGETVQLSQYFQSGKPVILTLVYYECPMLCTLVLNGVTEAMKQIDWVPGNEFQVVTVSINPAETAELATLKKRMYLNEYGRAGAAEGWHFLVGEAANTRALADAVGFGYRWDEQAEQFVHQAAIMILTPEGKVSRYLYGVLFEPKTLRLSLVEASGGKIGTTADRFYLTCFHYDPASGSYAATAVGVLRWAGTFTLLVLVGTVAVLARLGAKRRARRLAAGPVAEGS